jgi:hypothetical protein
MDGGGSRTRLDMIGGDSVVDVQWSLGRAEFDQLITFYRDTINFGADPFLMDLYLDFSELTEHECYFIPGSLKLQGQRAHRFDLTAQLEIKPLEADEELDNAIVEFFNEYESIEVLDETLESFETLFDTLATATPQDNFEEIVGAIADDYCSEDVMDETLQGLEDLVVGMEYTNNGEQYLAQELIIEYGSAEEVNIVLGRLESFSNSAFDFEQVRIGNPLIEEEEVDPNLVEIIEAYGSEQAVDDILGHLEEHVNYSLAPEVNVEAADPTLEELKAPLIEEYCSEDILDQTLQSLEDLVVNLEIPELPYDNEEDLNGQEVIVEYGGAQAADDVLEYLEFLVNREIPNLVPTEADGVAEPTLEEIVEDLAEEYCSESILDATLEQLELTVINLQIDPPMSDVTEGLEDLIDELGDI